jgi:hypothetical protein
MMNLLNALCYVADIAMKVVSVCFLVVATGVLGRWGRGLTPGYIG